VSLFLIHQGNVDPMVLFGTEDEIRKAVTRCLVEAGPRHHILNVRAGCWGVLGMLGMEGLRNGRAVHTGQLESHG